MGGLVLAGNTSGSTTLQATDAVTATITLPSATDTLVGKTTPSFTTTIGVGNATPSASGAGITFPATQSASTDANTLDDYEEGTWTPTFLGVSAATYSVQNGWYIKTGRQVTCGFEITTSATTGTAAATGVTGLPFTSATAPNRTSGSISVCTTAANYVSVQTFIDANSTDIVFYVRTAATAVSGTSAGSTMLIASGATQIIGQITYRSAT